MELAELKESVEALHRDWKDYRKTNDERLVLLEKGRGAGEVTEKLSKMDASLDALEDKLTKRADALERRIQTEGLHSDTGDPEKDRAIVEAFGAASGKVVSIEQYRHYKRAQLAWLRRGPDRMSSEDLAALEVGDDGKGGYLVTPDTNGRVVTRQRLTSPIRQIANVQSITTDSLEGVIDKDEADSGWVAEKGTRSETTTPGVEKWSIPVHEQYAAPRATQKVLDDASIDIEAWLAGKIADKFTRRENTAFVAGDGIGKPRGFTSYVTAATADDTRAWGQIEHVLSGVSGLLGADAFFTLLGAFADKYLGPNFRWGFHRLTLAAIRKLKDGQNNYLWEPNFAIGEPATLLAYQYVRMEDMPVVAANALAVVGGDFQEGYQIVDRMGIRVLRDPYTAKPYVEFYTTKRVGGAVIDFNAIKLMKITP